MKLIAQGAESKLYLDKNRIIKHRFRKKYRIKDIDERLRKSRTKREAKVLQKLEAISFPSPKLLKNDEKEKLEMENIKGKLLRDVLEKENYIMLSKEIGEKIAVLHNNNIIHGDLTTSNMILNKEIYFIDFGLSFFSHKIEDKAVDLHLLKEALESKHYKIWEKCYKTALRAYEKKANDGSKTVERLKIVESRGRYKQRGS
jgi:TP53 regulating kinase and related kinases